MTTLITVADWAYSAGHMVKITLFQMDILIVPRLGLGFLWTELPLRVWRTWGWDDWHWKPVLGFGAVASENLMDSNLWKFAEKSTKVQALASAASFFHTRGERQILNNNIKQIHSGPMRLAQSSSRGPTHAVPWPCPWCTPMIRAISTGWDHRQFCSH